MGAFLRDHTTTELICQLNSRFHHGDQLAEVVATHKAFGIFGQGKNLTDAYRSLNIVPADANERQRWYAFLGGDRGLKSYISDDPNVNGHDIIVNTHRSNLESANPLPVYVTVHLATDDQKPKVKVGRGHPIIYAPKQEYIVISIPVTPADEGRAQAAASVRERRRARRGASGGR